MKPTLWTKNFTLLTVATVLGAAGSIASGFALSFLVFDETGSTLASALILSMRVIPGFVLPLFVAPWTACRASPSSWAGTPPPRCCTCWPGCT